MSTDIFDNICVAPANLVYATTMAKWITTHEACKILRIHKYTLFSWGDSKKVKMRRISPLNVRLFDEAEIMALAKSLPKKRGKSLHIFPRKK